MNLESLEPVLTVYKATLYDLADQMEVHRGESQKEVQSGQELIARALDRPQVTWCHEAADPKECEVLAHGLPTLAAIKKPGPQSGLPGIGCYNTGFPMRLIAIHCGHGRTLDRNVGNV